jgi:hypothetical protein
VTGGYDTGFRAPGEPLPKHAAHEPGPGGQAAHARPAALAPPWPVSQQFARLGIFSRRERLEQAAGIIGRPLDDFSDLTAAESTAIVTALKAREIPQDDD